MSIQTVSEIFYQAVERDLDRLLLVKRGPQWQPISSAELYRDVVGTAQALSAWGVGKGDRVAILSENRPEWPTADYASVAIGAVVVPVYPTLTPDQIAYILRDSGARVLFLSTIEQLRKFESIKEQTAVEKVVMMDDVADANAIPMRTLTETGPTARDAAFDARARQIGPDDLATIIYTSGTTGVPKGAMLTHWNLVSNVLYSMREVPITDQDIYVSFLPLSHVTARHVDYSLFYRGVRIAYVAQFEKVMEALQEIRPTFFVGIPRVFEKVRAAVESKSQSGIKQKVYRWAMEVGRENRDTILNGGRPTSHAWKLANKLLYGKVRAALGGRVKVFISGGAPLGRELAEWYADIGIRIHEGYGLTETSPVLALNTPTDHRLGSVGKPLKNVEVRIADDGEILARGPSIFKGYWQRPDETANSFTDGWFNTGDIGHLDADGYLFVTDRKKNLIKTSGGKFIAPQPIESVLKNHPLIGEAAVIGDRRKFPAVVIAPQFEALQEWCRENNVPFSSREELVANPQIRALYEKILAEVNANLAQFEKMKKFLLISDEFTIANGFLTPTMKLRRRALEDKYHREIDALYAEAKEPAAVR